MSTSHSPMLPAERDDPMDRVLDMIEVNIETAIDLGLEPQLRARLARLLPAPAMGTVTILASGTAPAAGSAPVESPAPTRDPLDLAAVLTVCRELETYKLRAAQHAAIARLKGWLVAELTRLNAPGSFVAAGDSLREPAASRVMGTPSHHGSAPGASGRLPAGKSEAPTNNNLPDGGRS